MSSDREEKVYQAKLAEQAERYDGKFILYSIILHDILEGFL